MHILILGAGGLLGRHISSHLPRAGHRVVARTHAGLDITSPTGAVDALKAISPDLVINAAGLVSSAACEADPDASRRVNLEAPLRWASLCADRGIPFWAFSSDYIFDGSQREPYREDSPPNPRSVYARHKAELEASLVTYPKHLVLRVSWIYGTGGKTYMSLLPGLLASQEEVTVASGKRGSCLYAADAAVFIEQLLPLRPTGILNLVNAGEASWEGFANCCLERMAALGLSIRCRRIRELPFRDLPALGPGARPAYSVLATDRLERLVPSVPTWQAALDRWLQAAGKPSLPSQTPAP